MQLLQGWTILSYDSNRRSWNLGSNLSTESFSLSETHNTHSGVQTETQLIEIHMPSQLKEKKNRKNYPVITIKILFLMWAQYWYV